MSKSPPIPPEQRSGKASGIPAKDLEGRGVPQRDHADMNLKSQGRYGNISQNITHQGRQQDR